jgi:hypothetical protein
MNKIDEKLARWKDAIPRMNEEDLEFVLDFSECFEPQFTKMVKARYDKMAKLSKEEEEEEEEEEDPYCVVTDILDEMGCKYESDTDDDITFTYKDTCFCISTEEGSLFITIWNFSWMQVSLAEPQRVSLLLKAINQINYLGEICTTYSFDHDAQIVKVHSGTKTLFFSDIYDRKGYLKYLLMSILNIHDILEEHMQELYNKEHLEEKGN